MIFAEIILGVGLAFTSGADSALLFVSLLETNRAPGYLSWEGKVRAASQVSEAVSSGLGGWLYSLGPRVPLWLQVPIALAGLGAITATAEIKSSEIQNGSSILLTPGISCVTRWYSRRACARR